MTRTGRECSPTLHRCVSDRRRTKHLKLTSAFLLRQVLSNLANFKSFGATKFIPRVSDAALEAVVSASERSDIALPLWNSVSCLLARPS